jgi:hypothetical protein
MPQGIFDGSNDATGETRGSANPGAQERLPSWRQDVDRSDRPSPAHLSHLRHHGRRRSSVRKLGTQNRSLTAADHRGGAGVGQFDQQPIDPLASFLDLLALDLDLPLSSIRPIALVFDVLAQHLDGL